MKPENKFSQLENKSMADLLRLSNSWLSFQIFSHDLVLLQFYNWFDCFLSIFHAIYTLYLKQYINHSKCVSNSEKPHNSNGLDYTYFMLKPNNLLTTSFFVCNLVNGILLAHFWNSTKLLLYFQEIFAMEMKSFFKSFQKS